MLVELSTIFLLLGWPRFIKFLNEVKRNKWLVGSFFSMAVSHNAQYKRVFQIYRLRIWTDVYTHPQVPLEK